MMHLKVVGWILCSTSFVSAAGPPANPKDVRIDDARKIVAAIVRAAQNNQRLPIAAKGAHPPHRRSGDVLAEFLIGAGAAEAVKLPARRRARAFLLGIGVALDSAALLRQNPVTGRLWRRIETDKERKGRLAVLGKPTMHGRHDLAQHFCVSAALTAANGPRAAEAAGILKEMLDAEGASGFSFCDLAADLSGIAFAEKILAEPARLADLRATFKVRHFVLPPAGLEDGLSSDQFAKRYGSISDKRFRAALETLRKGAQALPGHKKWRK
jgi:hypothetical protein